MFTDVEMEKEMLHVGKAHELQIDSLANNSWVQKSVPYYGVGRFACI